MEAGGSAPVAPSLELGAVSGRGGDSSPVPGYCVGAQQ